MTDWFTEEDVERVMRAIVKLRWPHLGKEVGLDVDVCGDVARAALSAVRPNQWRQIDEDAKNGTEWLLLDSDGLRRVGRWSSMFGHFLTAPGAWKISPTHYASLPQPPEGEK